jgi:hypothetical protein
LTHYWAAISDLAASAGTTKDKIHSATKAALGIESIHQLTPEDLQDLAWGIEEINHERQN